VERKKQACPRRLVPVKGRPCSMGAKALVMAVESRTSNSPFTTMTGIFLYLPSPPRRAYMGVQRIKVWGTP